MQKAIFASLLIAVGIVKSARSARSFDVIWEVFEDRNNRWSHGLSFYAGAESQFVNIRVD